MTKYLAIACCVLLSFAGQAQPFQKAADNALVITRMAAKFHFAPVPLNDSFSVQVFNAFLQQADPEKVYFTQTDIDQLSTNKTTLYQQIQLRQTGFVALAAGLYSQRVKQVDSLLKVICSKPFSFSASETLTMAEVKSYPANLAAQRTKLYKIVKKMVLDNLLQGNDSITTLSPAALTRYTDSLEPLARGRVRSLLSRTFNRAQQLPGGTNQQTANYYCKAIATSFDPHTAFMPLTEKENFEAQLGNKRMVFGFGLDENDKGEAVIDELLPGSPAFKSGQFNKGDKIISVQWVGKEKMDVSDAGLQEIYELIRASNQEELVFTVRKPDGTTRQVPLVKEAVDPADEERVKSFVLKGAKTIGYISLPAFYEDWEDEGGAGANGCANDVAREIVKLKKEKIDGLVLDLRYNGGGSLAEAVALSGIFIDGGPVEQIKTREAKVITLKDGNRGTIYDGPLVVMVNGYSASASEMVAGTLQDYNRAIVVGSPTYGKATAQAVFPMDTTMKLDDDPSTKKADSYLKITTAQIFRVNGKTAQESGVLPDVLLPDLLQVEGERETDNPMVLKAGLIEANKYYKPYAPLPLQKAAEAGKLAVQQNPYLQSLQQYIDRERADKNTRTLSLALAENIARLKARQSVQKPAIDTSSALFTISSLPLPGALPTNTDEVWGNLLLADPYVASVYRIMLAIIP